MVNLSKKLRDYLQNNHNDIDLPFIWSFPKNCCETASLLLGKVLLDEFSEKEIFFVEGTDSKKYERHFWIEIEEMIFDITADQFEEIAEPIYGKISSALTDRFNDTEKQDISEVLTTNDYSRNSAELFEYLSKIIRGWNFLGSVY